MVRSISFSIFLINNCRKDLCKLPSVYVRPVELNNETKNKAGEDDCVYQCPVFLNRARQVSPIAIPLNSTEKPDKWILAGTALILDPGKISFSMHIFLLTDILGG